MKTSRATRRALRPLRSPELQDNFVKGFVSTGLLAGIQGGTRNARGRADPRRVLRLALQGGTALAAGSAAADALQRRAPASALAAIGAGAVGLMLIERLLQDKSLETPDASNKEE